MNKRIKFLLEKENLADSKRLVVSLYEKLLVKDFRAYLGQNTQSQDICNSFSKRYNYWKDVCLQQEARCNLALRNTSVMQQWTRWNNVLCLTLLEAFLRRSIPCTSVFTPAAHNPSQLVSISAIGERIIRARGADECRCLPRKRLFRDKWADRGGDVW